MFRKRPILKLAMVAFVVAAMACLTITISNYLISRRPIYVQNNTGLDGKPVNNISVSATGKVSVTPDIVTFTAGYTVKKINVSLLQEDLNEKNNAIIEAIKDEGVEDKDITTILFDMEPSYRYDYDTGERINDGQEGTVEISVKVRDMDKAGEIMDAAVTAGANTIGDVAFTVDDLVGVRSQARELAAQAAKAKAETLAESSGVDLGGLIAISESTEDYSPITYNAYGETATRDSSASPTISAGSLEITITVEATYGIR